MSERDCMKKGRRAVVRYSNMYEKTLPNRSIRCRMELHRTSLARSQRAWTTENSQPARDPRRHLPRPMKCLQVPHAPSRLSSMAHRLLRLQNLAHREGTWRV